MGNQFPQFSLVTMKEAILCTCRKSSCVDAGSHLCTCRKSSCIHAGSHLCTCRKSSVHMQEVIFFFKLIYLFLFLAVLGLRCCAQAFSSCSERGLLFIVVCGLLIFVASLVGEHGLQAHGLQQLWHTGSVAVARRLQSACSVVVAHRLSCSAACGIFPGQGSNLCALHWQADS